MRLTRGWWRLALAVVTIVGATASLLAHPAATTTVSIAVDTANLLTVTIDADTDPLIAKLEALRSLSGERPSTDSASDRTSRLMSLTDTLGRQIEVDVDGTRATLTLNHAVVAENGKAEAVFRSRLAPGARTIVWHSTLVYGSYPVAFSRLGQAETVVWLQGPEATPPFALANGTGHLSLGRGVWMGFTHILPNGLDHILFVTGLFLLSTRPRQVLAQVSAFTLAHSITLGLSLYGVFSLPSRIVEPLIALSVAYVGVENLLTSRLQPWRVLVVFGFGLLHGLGFAQVLADLHLSRTGLLATLVSFNVGVEAGQLTVIAIAAIVLYVAVRVRRSLERPITQLASAAIGLAGLAWMIQRVI